MLFRSFIAMIETKYETKVRRWMSDAGGEYKSKAFLDMLKDKGIEILQSAPHAHQQNGRAERIIRTLMDKAQAMRLQACLPQSWWEFALEHATHVYNRTPSRRLSWQTPYAVLNGEKPTIDHLRVFGCGTYVYIPAEIRTDKLAPKSELMTYLGIAPGVKGWKFMRGPNNIIFTAANAIFDEEMFPKCPQAVRRPITRLQSNAPSPTCPNKSGRDTCQCSPPESKGDDDESEQSAPQRDSTPKGKGKGRAIDDGAPSPPPVTPKGEKGSLTPRPPAPEPTPTLQPEDGPSRPARERRPPLRPGNVYGEREHPLDIEKRTRKKVDWKSVVGERAPLPRKAAKAPKPSAPAPPEESPTRAQLSPPTSDDEEGSDAPSVTHDSEPADDSSLEYEDDEGEASLAKLCWEGGTAAISFLLSKAITPTAEDTPKHPKEWTYRDIAALPPTERELWRTACSEELDALRRRNVFDLVERPRGRKVIKNRWVFDIKPADNRKKARLVAKGFSQKEGLDYDQVFSPVVRFETVRLILAMAALEDWYITGVDVRNAYLYGKLDEEIYMEQPEGFVVPGSEHKVLRLLRALYGLKQAGLAWWRALKASMVKLGFTCLNSDAGLFLYEDKHSFVIAVIYVDDSLFLGPIKALVQRLKSEFMKVWETRDLGDVTEFLHMRISREDRKIHLDQTVYLQTVLQRCEMSNAKFAVTPLPAGYVPEVVHSGYTASPELRSRFQTVIGSLLYLMLGTRPDISFAVTKLAQFAANPSKEHLDKALYICRYLVGTKDYRLTYDGQQGRGLVAFTDSDWASDPNRRRSQTGFFLSLAGGLISWTSRAQKTIALSSTEAEYMALSDCSRQIVWMHTLMGELGYQLPAIPVHGDNQGSIFIASNPVTEKRSKHIDIRFHYIREVVDRGLVELYFINGEENPADLLTKNLGRVKFQKFRAMLGLEFFNSF